MECSLCRTRGAIGYCVVCHELLCEVCGKTCAQCGQMFCVAHGKPSADGRLLCKKCTALVGGKGTDKGGSREREPEALSFEALSRGIEAPPAGAAADDTPSEASRERTSQPGAGIRFAFPDAQKAGRPAPPVQGKTPGVPIETSRRGAYVVNENDFRVLTASSPKATPMWVGGLLLGTLSCLMVVPLIRESAFGGLRQLLAYVILLVSAGTLVWCGYGVARRSPPKERWLCLVGLLLGLAAGTVALIVGMHA